MIVPAVVHWRVGHFGAILREQDGTFHLKDPTFRNDTWLSAHALDQEASGYFLVPTGPLPKGWSRATIAEASTLYGKGYTDNNDDDDTCEDCEKRPKPECPKAMATVQMHVQTASLHIEDTPVAYAASAGPDVHVKLAYNQRETSQPSSIDFTSFGPQFVSSWVSYLVDNTSAPSADVTLRLPGGGGETHSGFNSTTHAFAMQRKGASVLTRLTSNTYRKAYPDGSQEYYEQYIGTSGTQRKVFLSRVVDPQGNEVTLQYDTTYPSRISQIIDATGLATVFHYDYSGEPYLVTSIDDPFGRTSTFAYTTAAGKLRLQSSEDPVGIISSFTYNSAGEIDSMTTPYGTTRFNLSSPYVDRTGMFRYVEVIDPLGQAERIEFNINPNITGVSTTLETPQPSSSIVNFVTSWNQYRNSFYWDKLAMKLAPGNYLKAHRFHWVHNDVGSSTTGVLESEVPPLESRIFYNYPGQSQPNLVGTLASPSVVARVVKDASGNNQTQATKYEYNAQGNVTKTTDPVGREVLTEYATNGVDVTAIKQRTGTSVSAA